MPLSVMVRFIDELQAEKSNKDTQSVLLTPSRPDSPWYKPAATKPAMER